MLSLVQSIPFSQTPLLPKLVADYLRSESSLKHLYNYPQRVDAFEQVMRDKQRDNTNRQLLVAIDSIDREIVERGGRMAESNNRHFYFLNKISLQKNKEKQEREAEEKRAKVDSIVRANPDTAKLKAALKTVGTTAKDYEYLAKTRKVNPPASPNAPTAQDSAAIAKLKALTPAGSAQPTATDSAAVDKLAADKKKTSESPSPKPPTKPAIAPKTSKNAQDTTGKKAPTLHKQDAYGYKQTINKPLEQYKSILETFEINKRKELLEKARNPISVIQDQAETTLRSLEKTRESRVKHVFEFHSKFSLAMACVIFLFVGAPMGAIVRKGGFGWPLLISIVFFMLFIVISIFSKNIAERFVIDAKLAAWMNCLVVFPMGLALTYWAMRDMGWSQIVEALSWRRFLKRK